MLYFDKIHWWYDGPIVAYKSGEVVLGNLIRVHILYGKFMALRWSRT